MATASFPRRARACLLMLASCVAASCSDDDTERSTSAVTSTLRTGQPIAPSPTLSPGTEPPGYVAPSPTLPGRPAPDTGAEPLAFTAVRVFEDPVSGRFALMANVTNTSSEFLNELTFSLATLDEANHTLDDFGVAINALAAGETTTVRIVGAATYDDRWVTVAVGEVDWDGAKSG